MKRNINKETLKMIILVVTMVIIMTGMSITTESSSEIIGILFIFGLPTLFILIGFLKGLKKIPLSVGINENYIILNYKIGSPKMINFETVENCSLLIHSQKSTQLEMVFSNETIKFNKDVYSDFIDFIEELSFRFTDTDKFKIYNTNRNNFIERIDYNSTQQWYEFLEERKSIRDVLNEMMKESKIKRISSAIVFSLILIGKNMNDIGDFNIIINILLVGFLLYIISEVLLRKIGYSREECPLIFVSGIFYVLLGVGSIIIIVFKLLG